MSTTKKTNRVGNQSGQVAIETVLLLSVLVSLSIVVVRTAKQQGFLQKIVQGPWAYIQGMAENGVWAPRANSATAHPHVFARHGTPEGPVKIDLKDVPP